MTTLASGSNTLIEKNPKEWIVARERDREEQRLEASGLQAPNVVLVREACKLLRVAAVLRRLKGADTTSPIFKSFSCVPLDQLLHSPFLPSSAARPLIGTMNLPMSHDWGNVSLRQIRRVIPEVGWKLQGDILEIYPFAVDTPRLQALIKELKPQQLEIGIPIELLYRLDETQQTFSSQLQVNRNIPWAFHPRFVLSNLYNTAVAKFTRTGQIQSALSDAFTFKIVGREIVNLTPEQFLVIEKILAEREKKPANSDMLYRYIRVMRVTFGAKGFVERSRHKALQVLKSIIQPQGVITSSTPPSREVVADKLRAGIERLREKVAAVPTGTEEERTQYSKELCLDFRVIISIFGVDERALFPSRPRWLEIWTPSTQTEGEKPVNYAMRRLEKVISSKFDSVVDNLWLDHQPFLFNMVKFQSSHAVQALDYMAGRVTMRLEFDERWRLSLSIPHNESYERERKAAALLQQACGITSVKG